MTASGPEAALPPGRIAALFTHAGGDFLAARWRRPVVPVIFGLSDGSLPVFKGAIEAAVATAGHRMAETDPEMGANLWMFFLRDWSEALEVPGLAGLVGDLGALVDRARAAGADRVRRFRFEADGAIRAAFVFLRIAGPAAAEDAEAIALDEAVRLLLTWAEAALAPRATLVQTPAGPAIAPWAAALLRAAYDPVLPDAATDPAHALRLAARQPAPRG